MSECKHNKQTADVADVFVCDDCGANMLKVRLDEALASAEAWKSKCEQVRGAIRIQQTFGTLKPFRRSVRDALDQVLKKTGHAQGYCNLLEQMHKVFEDAEVAISIAEEFRKSES
jgi:hypothetical protein